MAALTIQRIEPTPFFPKPIASQPLRQQARLYLDNTGTNLAGWVTVKAGNAPAYTEELGRIAAGKSTLNIHVPDISAPAKVTVEVLDGATSQSLAKQELTWQPEKKWTIYCVAYSHHDLGYGNYPHRVRTEIRHGNIERPLQFCDETDAWDKDSQFRFVIESSEPITSFLGSHSAADAARLARRIREGRIQIGAALATVSTEQLSHELMARLFYLSGRHTPDLLEVPRGRTALIDDVIGQTWPFATALKAAGVPYFFHGFNGYGAEGNGFCERPAEDEPVFYWQGPDQSKVLERAEPYAGLAGDRLGDGSPGQIEKALRTLGKNWPYDAFLFQDGSDFQLVTRANADRIHHWNHAYAYPHLICATMDMFFDALAAQARPSQIKTFAKDANNEWTDEDASDAWLLGHARRLGEAIPNAEKFATIAGALGGGSYPWTDLYQAYHRLLLYHEHTDGIDHIAPERERMRQYETEQAEMREMVAEGEEFCHRAGEDAFAKLALLIATKSGQSLIVFNSLCHQRTDVVRFDAKGLGDRFEIMEAATGHKVPRQILADGNCLFIAHDVPSLGYQAYSIIPTASSNPPVVAAKGNIMENRFYRLTFNPQTGALLGIWDKELGRELVDQSAPHQFNEYLYEWYEKSAAQVVTSTWYRVESAQLAHEIGPVANLMTVAAKPKGVERLTQTILLYHDLKRIDFGLDLIKSPSGRDSRMSGGDPVNKESAYVALPLAVPDFRFKHELPGGVAEPIRDQYEGSCTAFYAVRHFSDVSNKRFGVTVSPVESSLVEYGYPRSCPLVGNHEGKFEREMRYPGNSRLYLYLVDNMFSVNIRWDQPGPLHFSWSLRSHAGDWQQGQAAEFGWEVHNSLQGRLVTGLKTGPLPGRFSFFGVNAANIECSTIKPAEANGRGYIVRLYETEGKATKARVTLPFMGTITAATETDLVENDLPQSIVTRNGSGLSVSFKPFGVKTIRVVSNRNDSLKPIESLNVTAVSDMQVKLAWPPQSEAGYYRVYRGDTPDFKPSLLRLVGRPSAAEWLDQPQLNYGGWINNRLEPKTTYYYQVAAVDRSNNEGPASGTIAVTTLDPQKKNMVPMKVEGLRAITVSPLAPFNFVNLLFRTSCESDVQTYEIHRSILPGFQPSDRTRIALVDANAMVKGSRAYGHVPIDHRVGDYDHQMFEDDDVQPLTTYYYQVRAVDTAGQPGPFSTEASAHTGPPKETIRP